MSVRLPPSNRGAVDGAQFLSKTDQSEIPQTATISGSISALALSLSGTHLLAGTTTGVLHILDVATSQSLRVLPLATGSKAGAALSSTGKGTGAPVTHLSTLLRPADLMGNVELGAVREAPPSVRPVANFARTPKAEAGGVEHVLPVRIGEERDVSKSSEFAVQVGVSDHTLCRVVPCSFYITSSPARRSLPTSTLPSTPYPAQAQTST